MSAVDLLLAASTFTVPTLTWVAYRQYLLWRYRRACAVAAGLEAELARVRAELAARRAGQQ